MNVFSSGPITQRELSLVVELKAQISLLGRIHREWTTDILTRFQRGAGVEPGAMHIDGGRIIGRPEG